VIRQLAEIRLSRVSLAALAALSLLATAMIISGGGARTPAQLAAAAALHGHPVKVVTAPGTAPAPASGGGIPNSEPSTAAAGPVQVSASTGSVNGTGAGPTSAPGGDSSSDAGAPSAPSGGSQSGGTQNTSSTSTTTSTSPTAPSVPADLPKVGHVFEIALSTTSYATAFSAHSSAPYLRSLVPKGTVLTGFHSLGSGELADNLALVSGQGPNADTASGCTKYAEFPTGVTAKSNGLVAGNGCVYPETALTIGDQVTASGHVWKAYVADMGKQTCAHPDSNAVDDSELPGTEPGYDTTHNPFIYFHSLLDLGDCSSNDADLSRLQPALKNASGAPTLSFIAPGECDDPSAPPSSANGGTGAPPTTSTTTTATSTSSSTTTATTTTAAPTTSSTTTSTVTSTGTVTSPGTTSTPSSPTGTPSACPAGEPVGLAAEDAFLRLWVPRILAAPSYRAGGVLLIVFTATGEQRAQQPVRTGALVLSRYARRGKTIDRSYGPYSVLRTIEQTLGYTPLAHAKSAPSFAEAALRKHG
jgi:phosphatidylinositol-3-phosphatase